MGKKKDKKKRHGAEKTAAKTDKKISKKEKKMLAATGEDDIESLIAEFVEKDKSKTKVEVAICEPPTPRSNMSLSVHPERAEIYMFGGELFTGNKTYVYNDLFNFNLKKKSWMKISSPNSPPPRCAHQSVVVPLGGGQIWVFGGEFASPTQSQFHHYKDLWCFHIKDQSWEQVQVKGGPSARSGHRMVAFRKYLIVFGGFHDNLRESKYYNDVYMFNLETRTWTKIEPSGVSPPARSACHLFSQPATGRIIMYGGYSKSQVKKDVEKGIVHNDMYTLSLDDKKSTESDPVKWKWQLAKMSGDKPSIRSGASSVQISETRAFIFGGVHDIEDGDDDEQLGDSEFYNDQYLLDLEKLKFYTLQLRGNKPENTSPEAAEAAGQQSGTGEPMDISEPQEEVIHDDGVFTVKIGPSQTNKVEGATALEKPNVNVPKPRMNAVLAHKQNTLFLYGGLYEPDDKQITLDDYYTLDMNSLTEWQTLHTGTYDQMAWDLSDESSSDSGSDEEEDMEN